ncbi:MAG TPA: SHOCT domain-containing protein [Anaerolineales bacterium]|jgi:putative membrane protein|nr:SHOCT domain-containing protein [Anaerolineales bacterium]
MFGNYGWGMMGGWGMLTMALFWIGFILLIVWVVRAFIGASPSGSGGSSTAREILDQRYARGEITRKEYDQMKKDIGS